jgi:hypothetical protein
MSDAHGAYSVLDVAEYRIIQEKAPQAFRKIFRQTHLFQSTCKTKFFRTFTLTPCFQQGVAAGDDTIWNRFSGFMVMETTLPKPLGQKLSKTSEI